MAKRRIRKIEMEPQYETGAPPTGTPPTEAEYYLTRLKDAQNHNARLAARITKLEREKHQTDQLIIEFGSEMVKFRDGDKGILHECGIAYWTSGLTKLLVSRKPTLFTVAVAEEAMYHAHKEAKTALDDMIGLTSFMFTEETNGIPTSSSDKPQEEI